MPNPLERYLGWCAHRTISRDKPHVVAIAGSVGKTSLRHALTLALEGHLPAEDFRTSRKNFNNELGVPLSVFASDAPGRDPLKWLSLLFTATSYALGMKRLRVRYLILEMGADHPGDIAYLTRMAPPNAAIITCLGAEHTEYFGSVEKAIEEERIVLRVLDREGEAILNADDPETWASRLDTQAEIIGFGKNPESTVRIVSVDVQYDPEHPESAGMELTLEVLRSFKRQMRLTGIFGEPHAYAIAAAISFLVAHDWLSIPAIENLQTNYHGMPGRTRLITGIKRTILLDDTYNAQPQAMVSAIGDLMRFKVPEGGRRIAALGDMLELGELAQDEHRKIGLLVAQSGVDILITCGKLGRVIGEAAAAAGMSQDRIFAFDASPEAGLFLQQSIIRPGDAILVKGSQSARMEKIVKELMAEPLRAEELLVRQSADWLKK